MSLPECPEHRPPHFLACRHEDGKGVAFVAAAPSYPEKPFMWVVSPWSHLGDNQARGGYVATKEEALALFNNPPAFERDDV